MGLVSLSLSSSSFFRSSSSDERHLCSEFAGHRLTLELLRGGLLLLGELLHPADVAVEAKRRDDDGVVGSR